MNRIKVRNLTKLLYPFIDEMISVEPEVIHGSATFHILVDNLNEEEIQKLRERLVYNAGRAYNWWSKTKGRDTVTVETGNTAYDQHFKSIAVKIYYSSDFF